MDAEASEQLAKERTRNRENLRKLVAVNKEKEALTRHAASLQAERDKLAAEKRSIAEAHELAQAQVDALAEELAAQARAHTALAPCAPHSRSLADIGRLVPLLCYLRT